MPEETSLHSLLGAQDQQLGVEQDHLPCGSTGSSWQLSGDGNVHGSGMPRQPLQNHILGHLGGWVMLWLADEVLDGRHQREDIPAHTRTAHKGLLQNRQEGDLC